jgi:hypothetical protein
MREDDHNIILRKHREVQGYSFQNISTQVNKFQPKQIYSHVQGLSPVAKPSTEKF